MFLTEQQTELRRMILEIDSQKSAIKELKAEAKDRTEDLKEIEDKFHHLALAEFTKHDKTVEVGVTFHPGTFNE